MGANSPYALEHHPSEPNPTDFHFSKRKWEERMSKWRSAWRKIHGVCSLMAVPFMNFSRKECEGAWDAAERHSAAELRRDVERVGRLRASDESEWVLQNERLRLAAAILLTERS